MASHVKYFDLDYVDSAFNPAYFMEKVYGLSPDPWQSEVLMTPKDRLLLLCSRQSGKSTVCAVMALHRAIFKEKSLVLIISNVFRQAEETFRKVKAGLGNIRNACGVIHETQTMLELSNGSRIISLPGKQESVRSFSAVALIIIDEAAQVSDDLYKSIRPMLAVSKGKVVALTTPFGKRGWFYNSWTNTTDWQKIRITATECPRITSEFLREEVKEIGEWWVDQEYFCKFVDAEDQIFSHDLVMRAITSKVRALEIVAA
jgi:hypothetical protein